MMTIAILPRGDTRSGALRFDAVASDHHATGDTVGSAIDALHLKLGHDSHPSLVVVQPMLGDEHFGNEQIKTLKQLMGQWRECRDRLETLNPASQQELTALVDAELSATIRRCEAARMDG
jgi:hypothetical protein